jgi:hypothetical protein
MEEAHQRKLVEDLDGRRESVGRDLSQDYCMSMCTLRCFLSVIEFPADRTSHPRIAAPAYEV